MEKWLANPKQQIKHRSLKPFQVKLKEQMKKSNNDKDQHAEDGMSTTSSQSSSENPQVESSYQNTSSKPENPSVPAEELSLALPL